MSIGPLSGNPLQSRSDLQRAVRALFEPLRRRFTSGCGRIVTADSGSNYTTRGAGLEGFARPLWGLAPLVAGGGSFDGEEDYRRGLASGTDPEHPDYWGRPGEFDQRYVECASLSTALLFAPQVFWDPLDDAVRKNLARWLLQINPRWLADNNWRFFRVLVNLALYRLNQPHDWTIAEADLKQIDGFYLGDGWYSDGATWQRDYYVSFAMHYYGLLYAAFGADRDPTRARDYRERAATFAPSFANWFTRDGAALPFGRSLTYRFAQGAFWAMLPVANVEAMPWGVVKGLLLRHMRWWSRRPVFTDGGLLSIGYGYSNLIMAEEYNGPASPYWAMKSFAALALPESHPFWQSEEMPLPPPPTVVAQPHAGMLLMRDEQQDHVVALTAGQWADWGLRHVAEKYAKFAYSTHFGFCVTCGNTTLVPDSMLAVSEDGTAFRAREKTVAARITEAEAYSRWEPYPDVDIETWLKPVGMGHIRLHRIRNRRQLIIVEGGFALPVGDVDELRPLETDASPGQVLAIADGASGIVDCRHRCEAFVSGIQPNLNVLHPRVVVPHLRHVLPPGDHHLACGVLGLPSGVGARTHWASFKQAVIQVCPDDLSPSHP